MNNLKKICAALLLLGLVACDDKASSTATGIAQTPQFDNSPELKVIEQLKANLALNPNDFSSLSNLGDRYFESRQYLEAIQFYDQALAVNPMCADCLNDKGLALYYTGNTTSALTAFEKAVEIEPGYVHAWLSLGYVLMSEGMYQEAIAPLNKVKELDTTGNLAAEADKFLAVISENNVQN